MELSDSMATDVDPALSRVISGGDPQYVQYFPPGDPGNPMEWSNKRKCGIVAIVGLNMVWATMMSAIVSPAAEAIRNDFNTSAIVSRLPVAVYLFGFAFGPVILTPLAEDYGRKLVFTPCIVVSYACTIGCGFAHNMATLVVLRFIAAASASPLFNSVCNIPDLFTGTDRVGLWLLQFWGLCAESIVLAPIFGGYILARAADDWRWIFWAGAIIGAALAVPFVLFVPETRAGPILVARARHARRHGVPQAWAMHEKLGRRSLREVFRETVLRAIVMLATEPIVLLFAIYDGMNYGLLYLMGNLRAIESVSLVYGQYGFTAPNINLVFIAIQVGYFIAIGLYYFQLRAVRHVERKTGASDVPEHKLLWGFLGGALFPISLYWFAWTAQPSVHYLASLFALCVFGVSSHILFLVVSEYTVDSYGMMASSAVTGQSLFRENTSGILALVAVPFYENVGIQWANTILAIIATLLAVLPFLFYRYGSRIRAASRYSLEIARLEREAREQAQWLQNNVVSKRREVKTEL